MLYIFLGKLSIFFKIPAITLKCGLKTGISQKKKKTDALAIRFLLLSSFQHASQRKGSVAGDLLVDGYLPPDLSLLQTFQ